MNSQPHNTAHHLYMLYEALPTDVQQAFLQELLEKQQQKNQVDTTALSAFQQFLIDSPEMSDEEYAMIEEKRQHLQQWK